MEEQLRIKKFIRIDNSLQDKSVIVSGWIEDIRLIGSLMFVILRDSSGVLQLVVKKNKINIELWDIIQKIPRQSTVIASGKLCTNTQNKNLELHVTKMQLIGKAIHPLPVDPIGRLESNIDTRLNHRALDMRNQRTASIFKLRHHVLQSLRKTLSEKKFLEITTPKIIGSASEGGANLFSLDYFGKTAYLAQSPQLYKEQMTIGLERVFEISNFYRAENSHTGRHLTEFTSIDIEAAFMDYEDVMDILEYLVLEVYKFASENCKKEQEVIGHTIEIPVSPFERITYNDCIEELKRKVKK